MNFWRVYLFIALPVLMLLCILTAPFQVPDEFAHYFRAIQLSHGNAAIVVAPDGKSAGSNIECAAVETAALFNTREYLSSPKTKISLRRILEASRLNECNHNMYKSFSNTALYFPITHLASSLGIFISRSASLPPLTWLYFGRLFNSLAAIIISAAAIWYFREIGIYILAISLLPMTLFEEASLAADAVVIPAGFLVAALTYKIGSKELSLLDYAILFAALTTCVVGKFAYMPIVILPPLVAYFERRNLYTIASLIILSIIVFLIWVIWSRYVSHYIFDMREDLPNAYINAQAQMEFIKHNPFKFLKVLVRSIVSGFSFMLLTSMGSLLGWFSRPLPSLLLYSTLLNAIFCLFITGGAKFSWKARSAILLSVIGCYMFVYVLIYIQYDPVGQNFIDGAQGRYLIPIFGFLPLLVPSFVVPDKILKLKAAGITVSAIVAVGTAVFIGITYWS